MKFHGCLRRSLFVAALLASGLFSRAEVNKAEPIAPDVYFHEGDIKGHGHCNNGWIVFEDYVLVIDANFPSGAREIMPKIRSQTNRSASPLTRIITATTRMATRSGWSRVRCRSRTRG